MRECLIAYGLLLVFMFGGQSFLALMHLSQTSLSIAGGVILFMIAIRMVFAKPNGAFGAEAGVSPSSSRWPSRSSPAPRRSRR